MDLRLRDGAGCDAAFLSRGADAKCIRLGRGNCRRICGTIHRDPLRQMGAPREEEEASVPRGCANGALAARWVEGVGTACSCRADAKERGFWRGSRCWPGRESLPPTQNVG